MDGYSALRMLRTYLDKTRGERMEAYNKGMSPEEYNRNVGRVKQLDETTVELDRILKMGESD